MTSLTPNNKFKFISNWICLLCIALLSLQVKCGDNTVNTYIINNQSKKTLQIFIEPETDLNEKQFIISPLESKFILSFTWDRPIKPSEQFECINAIYYSDTIQDSIMINLNDNRFWSRFFSNSDRSIEWNLNITNDILYEK